MKSIIFMLAAMAVIGNLSAQTKIKKGDKAPEFTGKNQDGKEISLKSLKGKKVVLYFYPKDQSPGCTAEACNLRDNIDMLTQQGYTLFGISTDDEASHREFREKFKLPFDLIADTDKSIHQMYGVWVEKERDGKKMMGTARTTFIIDGNGIITDVIDKVETKDHAAQILK